MTHQTPLPAVLSLGAGTSQLPLLETLRGLGYAVIAADRDPDAPGFERADVSLVVSTHDPAGVLVELERRADGYEVCGVLTQSSGLPVRTAALVAEQLGLPGWHSGFVERGLSKIGQLDLALRAGLPVAPELAPGAAEWPRMVRPSLPTVGKAACRRVSDARALTQAEAEARAASEDGQALTQVFREGRDLVLCVRFDDSRPTPLVLFQEETRFSAEGRPRGEGFTLPVGGFEPALVEALHALVERFALAHRPGTGLAFFSFREDLAGELLFIELHLDLGGDLLCSTFLPTAGLNPLEDAVRLATGGRLDAVAEPVPLSLRFLFGADLRHDAESKLRALRRLSDVHEVQLFGAPGGAAPEDRIGAVLQFGAPGAADLREARLAAILGRVPLPLRDGCVAA